MKGGEHIEAKDIRELMAVIKSEKAPIGVFITLHKPTKPNEQEALKEGFYVPKSLTGEKHPKIQYSQLNNY